MKYSVGFRNSVLRKVLPPENRSVYQVAKEVGISAITIQSWLSRLKDGTMIIEAGDFEPTPGQRGAEEKLKLLLESKSVTDANLGDWLRRHGLHSEHLSLWEQELGDILKDKQQQLRKENAELKKQIKQLQREITKKDKAMAEALAIITLKKKVAAIYANMDEEE